MRCTASILLLALASFISASPITSESTATSPVSVTNDVQAFQTPSPVLESSDIQNLEASHASKASHRHRPRPQWCRFICIPNNMEVGPHGIQPKPVAREAKPIFYATDEDMAMSPATDENQQENANTEDADVELEKRFGCGCPAGTYFPGGRASH